MKKVYLIVMLLFSIASRALCQQTSPDENDAITRTIANTPTKSSVSYEALTKFFQSTVTTLNGGGYQFKSTLFNTFNLFKDGRLDLSNYYTSKAGRFARNFEYSLGIDKGKSGGFNILTGGFKYAIINNRDKSEHNFFNDFFLIDKRIGNANANAEGIYRAEIAEIKKQDPKKASQMEADLKSSNEKFRTSHNLSDLSKRIQDLRDSLIGSARKDLQTQYDKKAKQLDMKSLLTLSVNPEYKWNTKTLDSTNFALRYLVGIGKKSEKPWFLDLQFNDILKHDTMSNKGLGRNLIRIYAGGNKILANDKENNPLFEMEFALEENWITNKVLYTNEERNTLKFDAVFSLHITKEFTLPVTLKYDLKKPNLFGFLTLQWNLQGKTSN
ncbi:hypothetical protein SAMN05192574_101350 [Mucilaginibacter gossypiicola]|uniref:DUF3078 domain-containing protein n=1 Tax=Mucilaginibacter gossypiicola TaxID=551995 RepID=A0A1H8A7E3_9SPHI|nr:hypothetical protein [Mucilaginibacter gossypiicola]SEM65467.1 hypothetical protein SAMN05192574_101350 [Mucilaginibacter gossypiicola]